MELFPIIYTSLLIAIGVFAVTVIISYITYKVRQNSDDTNEITLEDNAILRKPTPNYEKKREPVPQEYKESRERHHTEKRKEITEQEFYRHSSRNSSSRSEPGKDDRYTKSEKREIKAPSSIRKTEPERRIEILKNLTTGRSEEQTGSPNRNFTRTEEKQERKTGENNDRKKLKSIDDDPLNRYSDSSDDDDFQPLKTDD